MEQISSNIGYKYDFEIIVQSIKIEYKMPFNFKLLFKRGNRQTELEKTFKYDPQNNKELTLNENFTVTCIMKPLFDDPKKFRFAKPEYTEKKYKLYICIYTKTGFKPAISGEINLSDFVLLNTQDKLNELVLSNKTFSEIKIKYKIKSNFICECDISQMLSEVNQTNDVSKLVDADYTNQSVSDNIANINNNNNNRNSNKLANSNSNTNNTDSERRETKSISNISENSKKVEIPSATSSNNNINNNKIKLTVSANPTLSNNLNKNLTQAKNENTISLANKEDKSFNKNINMNTNTNTNSTSNAVSNNTNKELSEKLSQLESRVSIESKERQDLKELLQKRDFEFINLMEENEKIRIEVVKLREQELYTSEEISNLKSNCEALEYENKDLLNKNKSLQNKIDHLNNQITVLNESLKEIKATSNNSQSHNNSSLPVSNLNNADIDNVRKIYFLLSLMNY